MDNPPLPNFNVNFSQQPQQQQPAPAEKEQGKKGAPVPQGPDMNMVLEQVNSAVRRLRMLEERYSNLTSKNQLTDQNMLMHNKKIGTDLKAINMELTEMKAEMAKIKETTTLIIADLRDCARKDDIEVLEKYLKLWEPVRFVTASQVERIVRDVVESMDLAAKPAKDADSKK
jgi:hypothetical protein